MKDRATQAHAPQGPDLRVQLITFPGCPNATAARAALDQALAAVGIADRTEEVNTSSPETPESLRGWGSPTILLNGEDVGGQVASTGTSCRFYRDDDGHVQGSPPASLLTAAVLRAVSRAKETVAQS